jgi:hypothetical protein
MPNKLGYKWYCTFISHDLKFCYNESVLFYLVKMYHTKKHSVGLNCMLFERNGKNARNVLTLVQERQSEF